MRTKILLHGGRLRIKDKRNDAYYREITKGLVAGDEVLFVGFARRDEDDRNNQYEREKGWILAQTNADLKVTNATYDGFIDQVQRAKSVHITGGESPELIKDIQRYPDFLLALAGKTVGGSSAGACLFSTLYYYGEQRKVLEGLATVPIRLMVHYGSSEFNATDTNLEQLKAVSPELELVTLEECEWIERLVDI
jgi:hypothetical protein